MQISSPPPPPFAYYCILLLDTIIFSEAIKKKNYLAINAICKQGGSKQQGKRDEFIYLSEIIHLSLRKFKWTLGSHDDNDGETAKMNFSVSFISTLLSYFSFKWKKT